MNKTPPGETVDVNAEVTRLLTAIGAAFDRIERLNGDLTALPLPQGRRPMVTLLIVSDFLPMFRREAAAFGVRTT
jgi:hypothetical protein